MIRPRKVGKRGFKIDKEATEARAFKNPRSFVSTDGHDILFGEDKEERRREIFNRAQGRCEVERPHACSGLVGWDTFGLAGWSHECEFPHRDHCDCLDAGLWSCDAGHRMITPQVNWGPSKQQAHQDFEKLMEEK